MNIWLCLKRVIAISVCTVVSLSSSVVAADHELPNVLIIGDSISIGYTPIVYGLLVDEANVVRPLNENGGSLNCEGTTRGVERIDEWLAGRKWNVIHFNFGLHDLKHVHPDTGKNSLNAQHPQQADLQTYEKNLRAIVKKLKATGARLIFATTTPYPDKPGGPLRRSNQVQKYNEVAIRIMQENQIHLNDLHDYVKPKMKEWLLPRNVHFRVAGNRALAHRVAEAIRNSLK